MLNPKVDDPHAYPENTLFKLHEREIYAAQRFIRSLEGTHYAVARNDGEIPLFWHEYESSEDADNDVGRWHLVSDDDVDRLVFAAFGVDYDEYEHEPADMHIVACGQEPVAREGKPLTEYEATELAKQINLEGRYYHMYKHTRHIYRVENAVRRDDGWELFVAVLNNDEAKEWRYGFAPIRSRKDYRRFLATLAAEVIYR